MPITLQPPINGMAANRPVVFVASVVTGLNVQFAQVKVRQAGTAALLFEYNAPINFAILGGYIFILDIAEIVANYLAPKVSAAARLTSVFTENPEVSHVVINSDCYKAVYLEIKYFYSVPAGGVFDLGITDTTDAVSIFAAHQQQTDPYLMDIRLPLFGYGYQFLTNRPFGTAQITQENPFWASFVVDSYIDTMEVTTYDANGLLLDTAYKQLPADSAAPFWQITAGLGLVQLASTAWDSGAIIPTGAERRAIVRIGNGVFLPFGVVFSEGTRIQFDIILPCTGRESVAFLNTLGGADVVEFENLDKERTVSVERQIAQKPQQYNAVTGDFFGYSDKGKLPLDIDATVTTRVKATYKGDFITAWLSELVYSPEVYKVGRNYQQSFLLSVLVNNSDMMIARTNGERQQFFELREANSVQKPRY
jgi:hypothetical protein